MPAVSRQMQNENYRHEGKITRRLLDTWYSPPSLVRQHLLYPLFRLAGAIYRRALLLDQKRSSAASKSLPVPVISVGNLVVGGTGKTPMTLWLAKYLENMGLRVVILSRGYKGKSSEPTRVEGVGSRHEGASIHGDEPVLMAEKGYKVQVGRNRWEAARQAIEESPVDVFLLDDGFQHRKLERNLDIVLLNADSPWGNGLLLPFGPMREPMEHLQRADALVLTGFTASQEQHALAGFLRKTFAPKPLFTCCHRLTGFRMGLHGEEIPLHELQNTPVTVFSGLANPRGFLHSLERVGIHPVKHCAFPDHHAYGMGDLNRLWENAQKAHTRHIVTTEKDAVRLPGPFLSRVVTVQMELDFDECTEAFEEFLKLEIRKWEA